MLRVRPAAPGDRPRLAEVFAAVLRDGRGVVMGPDDAPPPPSDLAGVLVAELDGVVASLHPAFGEALARLRAFTARA